MKLLVCTLLLGLASIAWSRQRFDQHVLVRLRPTDKSVLAALVELERNADGFQIDFWKHPSGLGRVVDFVVRREKLDLIGARLGQDLTASIVTDIAGLVEQSYAEMDAARPFLPGMSPRDFTIDQYHSLDDIMNWHDSLIAANPNLASMFTIGKSFEGRTMRGIKIGAAGTNKPGFWLDCGIHAREWISPATCNYVTNELITKYATDPEIKKLVDKIDFYILPSLNPDGYEYTRSQNRMWRKTRSGPYCEGIRCCYGVDANRNWDIEWMTSGSSSNPCADTFAGKKPFSESETTQVSDFLKAHKDTLKAFITLHSYSQLWMYSYGYKPHTYPPDVAEQKALAEASVNALTAVHGTKYQFGTPADILYSAAGTSEDWAKAPSGAGIKWAYGIELRPDDSSPYGFALPADQIVPTGEETWAGLKVVANKLLE